MNGGSYAAGRPAFSWRVPRAGIYTRLWFIILIILFRLSLDYGYRDFVEPIFRYAGYALRPNMLKLVESYLLTIALAFLVPCRIDKPTDFLAVLFLIFPIVPTLAYYGLADQDRSFMWAVVLCFLLILSMRQFPIRGVPYLRHGDWIAVGLMSAATIFVLSILLGRGGLGSMNFDLLKVYDLRETATETFSGGFLNYLNPWVSKVFNIGLLVYAILRRSWLAIFLLLAVQVFLFGVSQHKGVLFYPVLAVGVYILFKAKYPAHLFVAGLTALTLFASLLGKLTGWLIVPSLFVRRIYFGPAKLNFAYYEYFSDVGFINLSNSIFSKLYDYPFPFVPAKLIGHYTVGDLAVRANAGFLATGYAHFGFIGMVVFSLIVGLLLKSVDVIWGGRTPIWMAVALVIVPFFTLFLSSDLFAAILTHGLALALLILWLLSSYTGRGLQQ